MIEKKKGKQILRGESSQQWSSLNSKRKISFTSSKNKIYFFDSGSAPLRLMKGDENTAFFRNICSVRQRRSDWKCGTICTTDAAIENAFIEHFQNIYTDTRRHLWLIDNLAWNPISRKSQEDLCLHLQSP